jgi:hypothetical protein
MSHAAPAASANKNSKNKATAAPDPLFLRVFLRVDLVRAIPWGNPSSN